MTDAEQWAYRTFFRQIYFNMLFNKDRLDRLQRMKSHLSVLVFRWPRFLDTEESAVLDKMINWNRECTIKVLP